MFIPSGSSPIKNTTYKVVVPFYGYAALSFLIATILMFLNSDSFTQHYFNAPTLAITHMMALGWGTMIILGASHQLFPVLIEDKLYSDNLAYASFALAGIGIPLLVYAFYQFNFGFMAQVGAILINLAVISYLINLFLSSRISKKVNIHAMFTITAAVWLILTTGLGLLMVFNFHFSLLPENSLHYLNFHAHMGIIGWFLLLILGVGSRLIPMFLISKYENNPLLWKVYYLVNTGLMAFIILAFLGLNHSLFLIPIIFIGVGIALFGSFIYKCYQQRIRKKVDGQVRISMASIVLMLLPIIVMIGVISLLSSMQDTKLVLLYGYTILFGWITAIILGMTFKTLPFIVWNKVYHNIAGLGKTPNPKDLFSSKVFTASIIAYLMGFIIFGIGILLKNILVLQIGTMLLLLTAVLYNLNVFKIIFHQNKLK